MDFDFAGELEEALYACDAAVIVVSAKAGIEVGTTKASTFPNLFVTPVT